MRRLSDWALLVLVLVLTLLALAGSVQTQQIQGTYVDLALPDNRQAASQFAAAHYGSDIYCDPGTGALVQISQQAGTQKVGEIAKFLGVAQGTSTGYSPLPAALRRDKACSQLRLRD